MSRWLDWPDWLHRLFKDLVPVILGAGLMFIALAMLGFIPAAS